MPFAPPPQHLIIPRLEGYLRLACPGHEDTLLHILRSGHINGESVVSMNFKRFEQLLPDPWVKGKAHVVNEEYRLRIGRLAVFVVLHFLKDPQAALEEANEQKIRGWLHEAQEEYEREEANKGEEERKKEAQKNQMKEEQSGGSTMNSLPDVMLQFRDETLLFAALIWAVHDQLDHSKTFQVAVDTCRMLCDQLLKQSELAKGNFERFPNTAPGGGGTILVRAGTVIHSRLTGRLVNPRTSRSKNAKRTNRIAQQQTRCVTSQAAPTKKKSQQKRSSSLSDDMLSSPSSSSAADVPFQYDLVTVQCLPVNPAHAFPGISSPSRDRDESNDEFGSWPQDESSFDSDALFWEEASSLFLPPDASNSADEQSLSLLNDSSESDSQGDSEGHVTAMHIAAFRASFDEATSPAIQPSSSVDEQTAPAAFGDLSKIDAYDSDVQEFIEVFGTEFDAPACDDCLPPSQSDASNSASGDSAMYGQDSPEVDDAAAFSDADSAPSVDEQYFPEFDDLVEYGGFPEVDGSEDLYGFDISKPTHEGVAVNHATPDDRPKRGAVVMDHDPEADNEAISPTKRARHGGQHCAATDPVFSL